ncbi:MAG: hypothetical protein ACI86C_000136 [Candidatus Latescibacterota bacterium]|jgi:hypothetical protein
MVGINVSCLKKYYFRPHMRPQSVTILSFSVGLFSAFSAAAQLTGGGNPPPPTTPPPELPLDSAIWLLLVAGVIYGIYFTVKKVRRSNAPA